MDTEANQQKKLTELRILLDELALIRKEICTTNRKVRTSFSEIRPR